jgi:uncharacterized repeat protein (TIGR03803 family)
MKKLLFLLIILTFTFFLSPSTSLCQNHTELWGMTSSGGNGGGVIFKTDSCGNNQQVMFSFRDFPGENPNDGLCLASNGKLYGMTYAGGARGRGVLFEYDPVTNIYTKKMDFIGITNGNHPNGSLIQDTNGSLYGMTSSGGLNDLGVLFEYNPNTDTYTKKFDFAGTPNGSYPFGSLLQASNGKLYGLTSEGGIYNGGVLFEYDPVIDTCIKKLDFDGATNGNRPTGTLIQASNGKFYGMSERGGANNYGVLFEYDPILDTCISKLDFAGATNGRYPGGSLIQASNGNLYGMTSSGGVNNKGVIFEYDPDTCTYVKKIDFSGIIDGYQPHGSLMQASNGKLYGMTYYGGANNMGVLFEYDPVLNTYTKKLDFVGDINGSNPAGSLMQASNGKLYGMTHMGGFSNYGVLFEYDLNTDFYIKELDFSKTINGSTPYGSLVLATNGKLYGMTYDGGVNKLGVIFEYNPVSNIYTKKLDFDGTNNGSYPYGSLIQLSNGNLCGMTRKGGAWDAGVIFEYNPVTNTYAKKLDFSGNTSGMYPYGSLIQATNGKLFGMTLNGGSNALGDIFEYDPTSYIYIQLMSFDGTNNGSYPYGSLIQATNGKLYGMTWRGGVNDMGVLFEYDLINHIYNTNIDFAGPTNGEFPFGSLMLASNGKLYGMTFRGGSNDSGVLFEYDIATNTYSKMLDFAAPSDGTYPYGSLMQASNGKLYGMTKQGGNDNWGVLFEYDPINYAFMKKTDFNGLNGGIPYYTHLIEVNLQLTISPEIIVSKNHDISFYPNPSNGQFTLVLDETVKIEIYNTLGILIYKENFEKGKHNLSLDLADGIYLLKATNDKASRSLKMLIQN